MRRSLRYTGVAAVATTWTTLLTAAALTRFNLLGDRPLSYMGTQSRSVVLFRVGLAVPAVLLTAFHGYVRGRYPVGKGFSTVMLVGLAGQMVAAFVPIGGDLAASRIHTTCALGLGASLPLLMWRFAAGQRPGSWRRLAYGLFWADTAACVLGLSGALPAPVAEIIPGAIFHVWIFMVTFPCATAVSPPVGWTPGAATAALCPAAVGWSTVRADLGDPAGPLEEVAVEPGAGTDRGLGEPAGKGEVAVGACLLCGAKHQLGWGGAAAIDPPLGESKRIFAAAPAPALHERGQLTADGAGLEVGRAGPRSP